MLQLPPSRNATTFRSKASCFRVTGHLETSAPNDPKKNLNTKRWTVPHIHVATTPEWQISLRFALRLAFIELWASLKQVHWITPKWPWTLKCQRYHIYMLKVSISLYDVFRRFRVTGHFETSAPNDSKITLNTERSKVTHIHAKSTRVPNFTPFCSTISCFRLTAHFETTAPNDPKWHWTLKGQTHPHACYNYLRIPNFTAFRSMTGDFQDIAIQWKISFFFKLTLTFQDSCK